MFVRLFVRMSPQTDGVAGSSAAPAHGSQHYCAAGPGAAGAFSVV